MIDNPYCYIYNVTGLVRAPSLAPQPTRALSKKSRMTRNAFAMRVTGPKPKPEKKWKSPEQQRFESLEKDSKRWFLMQVRY